MDDKQNCWDLKHSGEITISEEINGCRVLPVWYPVLGKDGKAVLAAANKQCLLYEIRLTNEDLRDRLITVTASLTEMYQPTGSDKWLPKSGAGIYLTESVQLYGPVGAIRVIGKLDYHRDLRIGVMLHLGFCK